jgi:hypothetical protein
MNRLSLIFLCIVSFIVPACSSGESKIALQVQEQVPLIVAETVAALPSFTPLPTYTPLPTLTAVPTITPAATYTPRATSTLQPTYTSYPTLTAVPSTTPTSTPIPVPVNASGMATSLPGANVPGDIRTQLLTKTQALNVAVEVYIGSLNPTRPYGMGFVTDPTDCARLISYHESIASLSFVLAPTDDPVVTNAYSRYQSSLNTILLHITPLTDTCRQSLARGEATKMLDHNVISLLYVGTIDARAVLNQIIHDLSEN